MDAAKQNQAHDFVAAARKRVADLLAKALPEELDATWALVDPKPAA